MTSQWTINSYTKHNEKYLQVTNDQNKQQNTHIYIFTILKSTKISKAMGKPVSR